MLPSPAPHVRSPSLPGQLSETGLGIVLVLVLLSELAFILYRTRPLHGVSSIVLRYHGS